MKCKEDCELPAKVLGWCNAHYQRQRRGSPMDAPIRGREIQRCSYGDGTCENQARRGNTVCKKHQLAEWRAGLGACTAGDGTCPRPASVIGLCETHYHRKQRGLPDWDAPIEHRMKRDGKCQHEDGCDEPVQARGWCAMHYARIYTLGHGDPGPVGAVKAARGEGSLDPSGYRVITVDGKRYLEHRLVMEQHLGRPLWPDESVHHKNGQRAQNDLANLELWAKAQPAGQRVDDIVEYWVTRYPDLAEQVLRKLRKAG